MCVSEGSRTSHEVDAGGEAPAARAPRKLRKLDARLGTQLELPRQPSEGCPLFSSFWCCGTWCGWGSAMVQDDGVQHLPYEGWPLPGCGAPTLYPFFFWTYSISLRGIRLGWSSIGASKVSRTLARRSTLKHTTKATRRDLRAAQIFPTWQTSVARASGSLIQGDLIYAFLVKERVCYMCGIFHHCRAISIWCAQVLVGHP